MFISRAIQVVIIAYPENISNHISKFRKVLKQLLQITPKYKEKFDMKTYMKEYRIKTDYNKRNVEYVRKHKILHRERRICEVCNSNYTFPNGEYIHKRTNKHQKALTNHQLVVS